MVKNLARVGPSNDFLKPKILYKKYQNTLHFLFLFLNKRYKSKITGPTALSCFLIGYVNIGFLLFYFTFIFNHFQNKSPTFISRRLSKFIFNEICKNCGENKM